MKTSAVLLSGGLDSAVLAATELDQGFDVVRTSGGHWRVTHPEREGCTFLSFSPKRPPGPETFKQLRALGYERGK